MSRADLSPLLDVRQNQLTVEISVGDSIDTKALGLLAGNIAILVYIGQANEPRTWWTIILVRSAILQIDMNTLTTTQAKGNGSGTSGAGLPANFPKPNATQVIIKGL
jgi:hypothetical protein